MYIDLLPPEQWESLNEKLNEKLTEKLSGNFSDNQSEQPTQKQSQILSLARQTKLVASRGLAESVHEVVASAMQFYSHKKGAVYIKGGTPAFSGVLPILYKEAYQVQTVPLLEMGHQDWVKQLKSNVNFVLYSEDHPLTGEIYPWQDLDRQLNEQKIFSIRVSHSNFLRDLSLPREYSVRICRVNPVLSLIFCGLKFKASFLTLHRQAWSESFVLEEVEQRYLNFIEDKGSVLQLEESLEGGFHAFFEKGHNRIFDRALIYHRGLNAEALALSLAKKLQWALKPPGWEGRLETSNLCRWGGGHLYDDWWEPQPQADILRGLLVLGAGQLSLIDSQRLIDIAKECQI